MALLMGSRACSSRSLTLTADFSGDRTGCPFAARCPLATDLCRQTEPELVVVTSVTSAPGEHRAACHYAEAVGRGDYGAVFSDGVVDNVIA